SRLCPQIWFLPLPSDLVLAFTPRFNSHHCPQILIPYLTPVLPLYSPDTFRSALVLAPIPVIVFIFDTCSVIHNPYR
ncbi:hypothetical protein BGZ83_000864, partial [Gryganskiella cystojenkinii]